MSHYPSHFSIKHLRVVVSVVLGSFQCRGVLLLWHMVGQGPTVLATGAGQTVGCFFFFFFSSRLPYLLFRIPHL